MFGTLTSKLQDVLGNLLKQKQITEANIADATRDVRMALLESDVHYGVASTLVKRVKEKAVGTQLLRSVSPGQQFAKIVFDELVELMGGKESQLKVEPRSGGPAVWMLCGLQGCGKTTTAAKLARWLQKGAVAHRPLLVACDLQRPAAVRQLQVLGEQIGVPVVADLGATDPIAVAERGLEEAKKLGCDVVIVDTAGRLHVDDALMSELELMKQKLQPSEILLVASAAQGQDALTTASVFHERLILSGSIVTMLDGTARAGVAVSLNEVIRKPIHFEGVGERPEDLRPFNPTSMAHRILGMGDTINLVRMAQDHFDDKKAASLEQKLKTASVTYEDFLQQAELIEKLGSMRGVLKMLPGQLFGGISAEKLQAGEKTFSRYRAIILSMTPAERAELVPLDDKRRRRVALGSGTSVEDVAQLVKSFTQMKQFLKQMPNMKFLGKMMGGGARWL
jgi:signal recognition particle subunit SRP54